MKRRYQPIDLSKVRSYPISERQNKVKAEDLGRACSADGSFGEFWDSLPRILAGDQIRQVVQAIADSHRAEKPVILAMGAHVIKCGLSPVIIDLMERGIITCVAMNGAGAIHDVEIALFGATSEEVGEGIVCGKFGMAQETAEFINPAIAQGAKAGLGMGEAIGKQLLEAKAPQGALSILTAGSRLEIPVTVHVAVGGDITHLHPNLDPAALGETSYTDFRIFCSVVAELQGAGVIINAGSAVILPMIIEKALAVTRNLGHQVGGFAGVNLDFIQHYRANLNPVKRAEELGGQGYLLTGHHEIMIPLIARGVLAELAKKE